MEQAQPAAIFIGLAMLVASLTLITDGLCSLIKKIDKDDDDHIY